MDNRLWTRRGLITGAALLPLVAHAGDNPEGLIGAVEKRAGGRLGVSVFDTRTRRRIRYRADERFPMCSTFKMLLAWAVVDKIEGGEERKNAWIPYTKADLLDYAPVARKRLIKGGMTVSELLEAAIVYSDNTAANLLLARIGGPSAVTEFARRQGDGITRLDRNEPSLNTSIPDDPRDTTTPAAMEANLRRLFVHDQTFSGTVTDLMMKCKTADNRIRAGLPAGWTSADKTGTGAHGSTNDIAILFPSEGGAPIMLAIYYTESNAPLAAREAVIADVARIVSKTLV